MGRHAPRIDAYIADAVPFARPILEHVRAAVHEACPGVEETLKWSAPSFVHAGGIHLFDGGLQAARFLRLLEAKGG